MKIKYIPIYTDDVEKQLCFFTEKLGFEICDTKSILFSQECTLIKTHNQDVFIIIIKQAPTANNNKTNHIVLNTDDCLNDYHTLPKY